MLTLFILNIFSFNHVRAIVAVSNESALTLLMCHQFTKKSEF